MQTLPMSSLELNGHQADASYIQNRYPLKLNPYLPLPVGSVKPKGWLEEQLKRMRSGLTGQLDVLYQEVLGSRNGWLGGDGDVWERGPYWLDGLIPLAYILDDQELKDKAQVWIEWTLSNQDSSGYFGPKSPLVEPLEEEGLQRSNAEDWWPRMVMLKVLQQYYSATGDDRVLEHMLRYFHYQLKTLPEKPLSYWSWWAEQRGGDNLAIVYWLYNISGDKFLLALAELIHKQTYNWVETFLNTNKLAEFYSFHCVNIAHAIKEPAVYYQHHPEEKYVEAVKKALRDLETYHGQPNGLFGGDELLHGTDPTHGSELCTAVEMMYSLETISSITGDVAFMDHLERIAFNALPTQSNDHYTARQYYQQTNQVMISRHERNFVTAHGHTDLCFGILTGYPCCTVNMHQGWPKLVQSLWQATSDQGLAALIYSSSQVRAKVANGTIVEFTEKTNYPFDEQIHFTFNSSQKVNFPLHLRVPGWCENAVVTINGEIFNVLPDNHILIINRLWEDGDVLLLILPMKFNTKRWHEGAVSIERGPLVFSLRIQEDWKKINNTDPHGDFHEVYPKTPWNYGVVESDLLNAMENPDLTRNSTDVHFPWNIRNAPLELKIKGKLLPAWKLYNESAGPLPHSVQQHTKTMDPQEITLIPYGCSKLRITEFPLVK